MGSIIGERAVERPRNNNTVEGVFRGRAQERKSAGFEGLNVVVAVCCCSTFGHQCVIGTQHIHREMLFDEDATPLVQHEQHFVFGVQIHEGLKCVPVVDVRGIDRVVGLHNDTRDLLWTIQFVLSERNQRYFG